MISVRSALAFLALLAASVAAAPQTQPPQNPPPPPPGAQPPTTQPSGRGGFEIEVEFAVQALRDLGLVDMRVSRRSLAVRRGVWRRCRLRRRLCRTGSLCVGALQGGAGTACKSQHQKDAKCPCDPLQQTHTRSPARPIDEATRL